MNEGYGFTYICEQIFSNISLIKNKLRSWLNDDASLDTSLKSKTTNYFPGRNKLWSEIQSQKSHIIQASKLFLLSNAI